MGITAISDYVYFKVEKPAEDTIETKFGSLFLANFDQTGNGKSMTYGKNTRIYGEVLSAPTGLSKTPIRRQPEGQPIPQRYMGHEEIVNLRLNGFPDADRGFYNCAGWVPEMVYLNDINPIIQNGDRIYYHFNTVDEDNRLKEHFADFASQIYKVRYDNIFCLVRNGEIMSVGDYVLVDKMYDSNVKAIDINGKEVMAKLTSSGIVTETGVRPKTYAGTIAYIGPAIKSEPELGLQSGDEVLFSRNSDWPNTIEGKEYFIMRQSDIIGQYIK